MPEGAKSREYNRKSFTLIEMIVTISILVVIVGASMPALFVQKKRAKLDDATTQLKDAILSTQNYAMAPGAVDIKEYALVIDKNASPVDYKIYSYNKDNPSIRTEIKNGILPSTVVVTSTSPFEGNPLTIYYRTKDYNVSFNGIYYGEADFDSSNLTITLSESGVSRRIIIQNTTGVITVENQ